MKLTPNFIGFLKNCTVYKNMGIRQSTDLIKVWNFCFVSFYFITM